MKHQSHSRDVRRKLRKTVKPIGTFIQSNATKGGIGVLLFCMSSRTPIKKAQNINTSNTCSSPRRERRHHGFLGVGWVSAGCGSGTSEALTTLLVVMSLWLRARRREMCKSLITAPIFDPICGVCKSFAKPRPKLPTGMPWGKAHTPVVRIGTHWSELLLRESTHLPRHAGRSRRRSCRVLA